jgi:hypothetical protein
MKRDWKLPFAMALLIISAITALLHLQRYSSFVAAASSLDKDILRREFGVVPATNCTYDCYGFGGPIYPGDVFEVTAVVSFLTALILITISWWKPKT